MVTRKQYTKEFKLDAISLILDQGHRTSTWFSNDNLDYDYGFDQPTHWISLQEEPK